MSKLFGFEEIEKKLLDNFNSQKLHHGLLLSGSRGIGKASFVSSIATKIILSSSNNKSEDLQKIISNSHPDLLLIKKEEKKRDITIDAVRKMNQFLSLTHAISEHRVIVIDAIDDLNKNSNNAILKTLEEPPKNVFLFLINHNAAKIIDTINSRCQMIKIPNLNYCDFKSALNNKNAEIEEGEIETLSKLTDNCPAIALKMHEFNAAELLEQIQELASSNNQKEINKLAKIIAADDDLWNIFEKLIIFHFRNLVIKQNNSHQIFTVIDKVNNLLRTTKNLALDKNQSIINVFGFLKGI
ncbi:MAG: DNA polymerase-3 subunit delta' [Lentimonas sp.]|jgi:DNA polymerase-3 subunit delta'